MYIILVECHTCFDCFFCHSCETNFSQNKIHQFWHKVNIKIFSNSPLNISNLDLSWDWSMDIYLLCLVSRGMNLFVSSVGPFYQGLGYKEFSSAILWVIKSLWWQMAAAQWNKLAFSFWNYGGKIRPNSYFYMVIVHFVFQYLTFQLLTVMFQALLLDANHIFSRILNLWFF